MKRDQSLATQATRRVTPGAALAALMLLAPTARAAEPEVQLGASEPAATPSPARSGEPTPPATAVAGLSAPSAWRSELTIRAWLTGLQGTVGVRGVTADVDSSFSDIVENSDSIVAFSGRFEFGKGRWGGFIDGMYSKLGVDDQSGPNGTASVDVEFEQALVDFGAMYRVGTWEPNGSAAANPRDTVVDLYAGGRYTNIDLKLSPATLPSESRSKNWIDPIIGVKGVLPIAESWHLEANGDIGGFGVASDFTWSVTALIAYDFHIGSSPASVSFGYRAIGQDYTDGSGNSRFEWDVVQHGPVLGFSVAF